MACSVSVNVNKFAFAQKLSQTYIWGVLSGNFKNKKSSSVSVNFRWNFCFDIVCYCCCCS